MAFSCPIFSILSIILICSLFPVAVSSTCPPGSVHIDFDGNKWSCFKFVNQTKSFIYAESDCQENNGHLVSIHNMVENAKIGELAGVAFNSNLQQYWIGLRQYTEGIWTLTDTPGQNATFFDWSVGQPVNSASNPKNCGYAHPTGYWYNDDCDNPFYYVCEVQAVEESSTTASPTTTPSPTAVCESFIPFGYDISTVLTVDRFNAMKQTILAPFLSQIFSKTLQPAVYCPYAAGPFMMARPGNVADIVGLISNETQAPIPISNFAPVLTSFLEHGVLNYSSSQTPVNVVVFAGSALTENDVSTARNAVDQLTRNGNTVSVVLMDPNMDQTYYNWVLGLNVLVFSDSYDTVVKMRRHFKCAV